MANPFFTIGHSTRPIDEFVSLLAQAEVTLVVDVRTVPRSRFNPQFNRDDALGLRSPPGASPTSTSPRLGACGGIQRDASPETNAFWENASFHNYADYAMSQEFRSGLGGLARMGRERARLRHVRGNSVVALPSSVSSPITSSRPARTSSIFWARGHIERALPTPAVRVGPAG